MQILDAGHVRFTITYPLLLKQKKQFFMESSKSPLTAQEMDKQALRVYGILAIAVYFMALIYCYFTSHFLETVIIGIVMLGLGVVISRVYASISSGPKNH